MRARETNNFWVSILQYYYSQEAEPLLDVLSYDELIKDRYIIVGSPENFAATRGMGFDACRQLARRAQLKRQLQRVAIGCRARGRHAVAL